MKILVILSFIFSGTLWAENWIEEVEIVDITEKNCDSLGTRGEIVNGVDNPYFKLKPTCVLKDDIFDRFSRVGCSELVALELVDEDGMRIDRVNFRTSSKDVDYFYYRLNDDSWPSSKLFLQLIKKSFLSIRYRENIECFSNQ